MNITPIVSVSFPKDALTISFIQIATNNVIGIKECLLKYNSTVLSPQLPKVIPVNSQLLR